MSGVTDVIIQLTAK